MTQVPFDVYPRRLVHGPDSTTSLITVRRAFTSRYREWNPLDGLQWWAERLARIFRRDRTWFVELYPGLDPDIGLRPEVEPYHRWTMADRAGTIAFAERLSDHVSRHGHGSRLPEPA